MWFVSHASADNDRVDQLAERLQGKGILPADLWIDHKHGIETGDEWQRNIQAAANTSEACIFVLTPASADSRWCEAEWTRFLTAKKKLYIVLLEPVPLDNLPLRLGVIQYADLTTDYDGGLNALIRALKGKADLDPADKAVKQGKRVTGDIDPRLGVPMQGRAEDLANALRLIQAAPLFITGIGGLGKSRLAYALLDDERWDGAVWHRCTDLSTPEEIYALLRDHYALDKATDPRDVLKAIRSSGRLLVVIDNAESVMEDARRTDYTRLINDLRGAGAAVCVTSRVEWRDVAPKRRLEPTQLDADSAMNLVPALARYLGIQKAVTRFSRELADAARRHPRLIELAVGKLDHMPADAVIEELKALKSKDMQEALTEMIRVTVDQMTAAHGSEPYDALRRLTVCRGGFTAEAAKAIAGMNDNDDLYTRLKVLTDYRFVRFEGERERYAIDDLVVEAVGVDESAWRVHYDYYFAFAWRLNESRDYLKYLKMDAERDNYDASFAWALANDPSAAYWLANACIFYLANRGRWVQRMDWFASVERALVDHPDAALKANVQNSLGIIYRNHPFGSRRDNLKRAVAAYEKALVYYPPGVAPLDYATTQNNLGTAYGNLAAVEDRAENLKRAVTALTAALVYCTPDFAPLDYAMTQNNLGAAYRNLAAVEDRADNLKRAVAAFEAALVYWTPDAAPLAYAATQNNLGNAYRYLAAVEDRADNLKRAVAAYEAAMVYWTPVTAPLDYALTQANLGLVLQDSGDQRGAIRCWRDAEGYFRRMDHVDDADKMLGWIADAERHLGDTPPDDGGE